MCVVKFPGWKQLEPEQKRQQPHVASICINVVERLSSIPEMAAGDPLDSYVLACMLMFSSLFFSLLFLTFLIQCLGSLGRNYSPASSWQLPSILSVDSNKPVPKPETQWLRGSFFRAA